MDIIFYIGLGIGILSFCIGAFYAIKMYINEEI